MKLAIVIATYQRSDNSTPKYLNRALNSVLAQTHSDYKVFLIGDHYENEEEFNRFGESFDPEKIYKENLPVALERSKYAMGSRQLWCAGGTNAYNTSIDKALSEGYDYICHLDHDDYWDNNHLEKINEVLCTQKDVACVYTCSTYLNKQYLPVVDVSTSKVYTSYPTPLSVIHSSTCVNFKLVPLRYRDVYAETGQALEGDIDLWKRLKEHCKNHKLNSFLVSSITCHHEDEKNTK